MLNFSLDLGFVFIVFNFLVFWLKIYYAGTFYFVSVSIFIITTLYNSIYIYFLCLLVFSSLSTWLTIIRYGLNNTYSAQLTLFIIILMCISFQFNTALACPSSVKEFIVLRFILYCGMGAVFTLSHIGT